LRKLLRLPALQGVERFAEAGVRLADRRLSAFVEETLPALKQLSFVTHDVESEGSAAAFCRAAAERGWWDLSVRNSNWGEPLWRHQLEGVRRGAVSSLRIEAAEPFEALLAMADWGGLRRLHLEQYASFNRGWAPRLAAHPGLGRLTELSLMDGADLDGVPVALFASPHLKALTRLDFWSYNTAGSGDVGRLLGALCRPGAFPRLRDLSCRLGRVQPSELRRFVETPLAAGLRRLQLECWDLSAEAAMAFPISPQALRLNRLALYSYSALTDELVRAFATTDRLPNLVELDLGLDADEKASRQTLELYLAHPGLTSVGGHWLTHGDEADVERLRARFWGPSMLKVME
jgi:hypothetical protein